MRIPVRSELSYTDLLILENSYYTSVHQVAGPGSPSTRPAGSRQPSPPCAHGVHRGASQVRQKHHVVKPQQSRVHFGLVLVSSSPAPASSPAASAWASAASSTTARARVHEIQCVSSWPAARGRSGAWSRVRGTCSDTKSDSRSSSSRLTRVAPSSVSKEDEMPLRS